MEMDTKIKDAVANNVAQTAFDKATGVVSFTYKAQEGTKLVSFEQALQEFVGSTNQSMRSARLATELAMVHYYNTGDLSQCQKFLDSIPKNYVRLSAYKSWLGTYCPCKIENGRLFKDKSPATTEYFGGTADHPMSENWLLKALAISFWDHKPEPDDIALSEGDVIKLILKTVAKMRGERYIPTDGATSKLNDAEKALQLLQ